MPRIGTRLIDPIEYSSSNRRTVQIPKQNLLHALVLKLTGTYTVTGGDAAGTPQPDAMYRLIENFGIIADGRQLVAVKGKTLGWIRKFFYPAEDYQDAPSNDTAGLSEAVEGNFFVPLHIPRSFNEFDALFPSYAVDSPQIVIDWAAASAAINGGTGVKALTSAVCTVRENPVDGIPLTPANKFGIPLIGYQEYSVTAASSAHKIYLEGVQPGEEIARIIVEAEDSGAYSDTLVTNMRVNVNGRDEFESVTWDEMRNRNKANYGLSSRASGAIVFDAAEDMRTGYGELMTVMQGPKPYVEFAFAAPTSGAKVLVTVMSVKRRPV